jgi:hypothetical protein
MNEQMSRRTFMSWSAAGLLTAALARGQESGAATPAWEKRLRVANASVIRLLHFTDIHFFIGVDKDREGEQRKRSRTQDDVRRLIDHARPDMLIVTGDLWHNNPDGRGAEFMAYAVEQCSSWGVPWTFTWGNHDQLDDYTVGHDAFTKARDSLYAGVEKDGNYVVALEGRDGRCLAEVFCLNSRGAGLDRQARRFVAEAASTLDTRRQCPLRLSAFHIPVKQYKDVWDNGTARGVIGEDVCLEREDGSSVPVLAAAGIRTAICGHDHVNDYSGIMNGVDLIYGRATGYGGYGGEKVAKGAKLYTLDPAHQTVSWVSLLPDGTTWRPGSDMRTDTRKS